MTLFRVRNWAAALCAVALITGGPRPASAQDQKPAAATAVQSDAKKDQAENKEVPDKEVPDKVVSEKEAIKKLSGDYRIMSGETSGKQILPDRLAGVTVRITEQTITTYDGDRQAKFGASYRLDTQKRPWRIVMTTVVKTDAAQAKANGQREARKDTSEGLVDINESQVKLIYALPNGDAPTSFKTGERQQLFVLERLKTAPPSQPSGAEGNPTTNPSP